MDEESELRGPFENEQDRLCRTRNRQRRFFRQEALDNDLDNRDLETSEIVNVTLLYVAGGALYATHSFIPQS